MTDQQITDKHSANGFHSTVSPRKGKPKQWKDLPVDPLAEGYDSHAAEYIVGKSPVSWSSLQVGQLFSRSKTGKSIFVKINDGRAICLDTQKPIEYKPSIRMSQQVWLVANFNSTTASKTDF